MKKLTVIHHVAFEDLGAFAPVLDWQGYSVRSVQAGVDDLSQIDPAAANLLIVLGGPIGVNDESRYPFLTDEIRLIERRLASGRPLLGVCLGAQLIARAAGARVYPGRQKEIGYAPVALSEPGRASCLAALEAAQGMVLHWHGDTFDLPMGAAQLASTAITPNQAFSMGRNVLGLQFHMEADPADMERWLIGHAVELAQSGLDVRSLRADIARHGAAVAEAGARVFGAWLEGLQQTA